MYAGCSSLADEHDTKVTRRLLLCESRPHSEVCPKWKHFLSTVSACKWWMLSQWERRRGPRPQPLHLRKSRQGQAETGCQKTAHTSDANTLLQDERRREMSERRQACNGAAFQKCYKYSWHQNVSLPRYLGLTFLYQRVLKAFQC